MHHAGRAVRHWLDTMGETDGPAVSGRDFFWPSRLSPRGRGGTAGQHTAASPPPPSPRSHLLLPRDLVSLLFACLRCLPVVFLPSVSNGAAGVRTSSKKRVGSGPRGLGPDGSSVVLSQSVYFAQRGGVVCRVVESGRAVVEWVSALMRWQVEVQPIPCCCRRLALVTEFDRPECPPLDPPVACSPTPNQPSTT